MFTERTGLIPLIRKRKCAKLLQTLAEKVNKDCF